MENRFSEMKGDVEISSHEKEEKQEHAYMFVKYLQRTEQCIIRN